MARRNIDIFPGVSGDHVSLNLPQTIEDLCAVDNHGEDGAEEQIVDEVGSPIDFPMEEMKDEQLQTIQLTFHRSNAVEGQQAGEIIDHRENHRVGTENLDGKCEISVPAIDFGKGTGQGIVIIHIRWIFALQ